MKATEEPGVYRVDAGDRLCFVNEAWLAFARENGATALTPESVLGRSLWEFIDGRGVVALYRALLGEVRNQQRVVSLPFRCDAPAVRREMELELAPLAGGVVEFRSHLTARTTREPVAILDATVARARWHVSICSWCKGIEVSAGDWKDTEAGVRALGLLASATLPRLAHTICPGCRETIRARSSACRQELPA